MALEVFYTTKNTSLDKSFIDEIYKATLKHFNLKDVFEVEITIVGEKRIKSVNAATRSIDKVTDVLSFPNTEFKFPFNENDYAYAKNPETGKIMLGELMLCEKRAISQAKEYGHSVAREFGFLVLHGLLHLMGFDHIKKEDEVVMMSHAEEILKGLKLNRDV